MTLLVFLALVSSCTCLGYQEDEQFKLMKWDNLKQLHSDSTMGRAGTLSEKQSKNNNFRSQFITYVYIL